MIAMNRRYLSLTSLLTATMLLPMAFVRAQSDGMNFVHSRIMLDSVGTSASAQIDYYDGLGRKIETMMRGASPSGADIVIASTYDEYGRPHLTSLPLPAPGNDGAFIPWSRLGIQCLMFYNDVFAYSYPVYEPSPLGKVLEEYGPGTPWQTRGHSLRHKDLTNEASGDFACAYFYVSSEASLTKNGIYHPGQLHAEQLTDEDGKVSITFKDKQDRVILERRLAGSSHHDTYYVYDGFGNLRYVLPPAASSSLVSDGIYEDEFSVIRGYCYVYKYDGRNRCIRKSLPGCEPIYMRYDAGDHLTFVQDGGMRKRQEWSFYFYDKLGRPVASGIWQYAVVPDVSGIMVRASRDFSQEGRRLGGYSANIAIPGGITLLSASYYDDYDFLSIEAPENRIGLLASDMAGYSSVWPSSSSPDADGSITGIRLCGLGSSGRLSVLYYDSRGRVAQTKTMYSSGMQDDEYFKYTFTGKPVQRKVVHSSAGRAPLTEEQSYSYDHAERFLSSSHRLNSAQPVQILSFSYDEVGRVSRRMNGPTADTLGYDVRSQMTKIKGHLFSETVAYCWPVDGLEPSEEFYDGRVGAVRWKSETEDAARGYLFSYDGLGRLVSAQYGEGSTLSENVGRFSESVCGYDENGNVLSLARNGISGSEYGIIDDLAFSYSGNRLVSATDASPDSGGLSASSFPSGTYSCTYDGNGNMTSDSSRGIVNASYNVLNLPDTIVFSSGDTVLIGYDSDGTKRREEVRSQNGSRITEYVGNIVYNDGTAQMLLIDNGYISLSGQSARYHFFIRDHLGSNRVVVDEDGSVEQVNHYYPFGALFGEGVQSSPQQYRFCGKELDSTSALNLYWLGSRLYDPLTARWTTQDPMSEKYYASSPYAYCQNDPVRFIDPDGSDIWEIDGEGRIKKTIKTDKYDKFIYIGNDAPFDPSAESSADKQSYPLIAFDYGTVLNTRSVSFMNPSTKKKDSYDVFTVRGDKRGEELFEFLVGYITNGSGVEFSIAKTGMPDEKGLVFITTSHTRPARMMVDGKHVIVAHEYGMEYLLKGRLTYDSSGRGRYYTIREITHSHIANKNPSKGDLKFFYGINEILKTSGHPIPHYYIYFDNDTIPFHAKLPTEH